MNVQFAVQDGVVFVLEVNPRASRTVPFVSKATGVPLAKVGARVMAGISLKEQGVEKEVIPDFYAVKEAVFPFIKFPGVDTILGPEMRSTGEVMGVGASSAKLLQSPTRRWRTLEHNRQSVPRRTRRRQTAHRQNRTKLPSTRLWCLRHTWYRRILERTRHHRASGQQSTGRPPTHRGRN